ncbi:R3HCC1L family protein [Megaselia abdita]
MSPHRKKHKIPTPRVKTENISSGQVKVKLKFSEIKSTLEEIKDKIVVSVPDEKKNRDDDILIKIHADIKRFLEKKSTQRVLLFPPVNNYYRFLIHQTCETYTKKYDIVTISIGSLVRRTVVCYRKQLKDTSKLGSSYLNGAGGGSNSCSGSASNGSSSAATPSSDNRKPQPRSWRNPTPSTTLTMGVERLQLNKSQSVDTQRPPDIEERRTAASSFTVVTNGLLTDPNSKEDINCSESSKSQRIRRERRPDRAVYVPRARRSLTTPPQVTNTLEPLTTNGELPIRPKKTKLTNSLSKSKSPYIDENVNLVNMSQSQNESNNKTPKTPKTDVLRIEGSNNHKDNDNDLVELKRASHEINRSNRRIIKQTFVSDVLEIPDIQTSASTTTTATTTKTTKHKSKTKKSDSLRTKEKNHKNSEFVQQNDSVSCDPETDDWDSMFDDNGECLDPKIIEELSASVGNVKIETPKMDYTAYHIKQELLNEEEYPHVLEVSNFPAEFKTPDLLMLFNPYKQSGYDIKWVDDTHALVVFSSSKIGKSPSIISFNKKK